MIVIRSTRRIEKSNMHGAEEQENGEKASKAAYLMVKVTFVFFILIWNIIFITDTNILF